MSQGARHRGLGQPHLGFRQRELPAALAAACPRGLCRSGDFRPGGSYKTAALSDFVALERARVVCRAMMIRGERRNGAVLITTDGAPVDWRASLAVRPLAAGTGVGLRRVGSGPVRAGHPADGDRPRRRSTHGSSGRSSRRSSRLAGRSTPATSSAGWSWRGDGRRRGGDVSSRPLLGAHRRRLRKRRETVAGECLAV